MQKYFCTNLRTEEFFKHMECSKIQANYQVQWICSYSVVAIASCSA